MAVSRPSDKSYALRPEDLAWRLRRGLRKNSIARSYGCRPSAFETMRTVLALAAMAAVGRSVKNMTTQTKTELEEWRRRRREVVGTYGLPRTATTLQNFAVRAFLCAAKAEKATSKKTHTLELLQAHAKEFPGWRRFATESSFEHPGMSKADPRRFGDLFGDGAHDEGGPPPGAWNQTARQLERLWKIPVGSLSYVQLTATVGIRDWKIVEDYRPFFDITDDEFSDVVQYVRAWDVLRRCCGPQMSADYRARLYNDTRYVPHRGPGSVDYDSCEMYDVDAIERELVGLRLFKQCKELRTPGSTLQEGVAWAALDGTFCSRYKEAAIKTGAGFNENPWQMMGRKKHRAAGSPP